MTVVNQPTLTVALLLLISFTGAAGIDPHVGKALASLSRIIKFFEESLNPDEELVPDLLFGVAFGIGQIRVFNRHLEKNVCTVNATGPEKEELSGTLDDIEVKMSQILRENRKKVPDKGDKYEKLLVDKMLDPALWAIDQPLREDSLIHPHNSPNSTMNEEEMSDLLFGGLPTEEMSDFCLSEILGVRSERCYVSSVCKEVLIKGGPSTGYPLTHRLVYVQAARQAKCRTLGPPQLVQAYIRHYCSMILAETEMIADFDFPSMMIDLFVEQVALCGAEGFTEFTRQEWVDEIFRWQRSEGCFGSGADYYYETQSTTPTNHEREEDALMESDCLMHFTGVAIAAIATSIRPMVECTDYDYTTRPTEQHE
ncbi:UPF0764 protein C16orf89 homolog [Anabrus simplex]|uniref:UPF0764 protein C16orf89 homolog n=1 Tax=Anabrus simplex TaxID=316456 RepID=UPI0035A33E20